MNNQLLLFSWFRSLLSFLLNLIESMVSNHSLLPLSSCGFDTGTDTCTQYNKHCDADSDSGWKRSRIVRRVTVIPVVIIRVRVIVIVVVVVVIIGGLQLVFLFGHCGTRHCHHGRKNNKDLHFL